MKMREHSERAEKPHEDEVEQHIARRVGQTSVETTSGEHCQ